MGLYSIDLRGTQVTDIGLAHLKGLTNLLFLDLRDTRVTDTGMQMLERALPKLKISH